VIPAFSEAWVSVRTNRSGLAALRPTKHRETFVQANNGVTELPPVGTLSRCLVANLTYYSAEVKPGQVVWLSETVHSYPMCVVVSKQDMTDPTWQGIVKAKASHLKAQEFEQLLKILESHDASLGWSNR
jgi:hypothetical protein